MPANYTHNFIINKIVDFHSKPVILSKRMFCKQHSIPKSTLDYWLHKYSNGTLFSEKKAGRPTIITDEILIFVDKYVSKRHNTTIQQVTRYLKTFKNIILSRTTIYKIMKQLKFVYKQKSFYTMSTKSNKKQTNIDIKNKQKEYNDIGLDNIVSIDEVPFYREMVSLKGWGKQGKKLNVQKKSIYSQKHSIVMAITNNKVVAYDIIKGSLNGESYAEFLEEKLIPEFNRPMHFLMDNVPFHKTQIVTNLITKHEHTPLYSVPYVPELNPIENIFSIIKGKVRRKHTKTYKTTFKEVDKAIKYIRPSTFQNIFNKSAGNTKTIIKR
jgi:transposase